MMVRGVGGGRGGAREMMRCRREGWSRGEPFFVCFGLEAAVWGGLMSKYRLSSQWARSIGVAEISQTPSITHVKYESVSAFRSVVGARNLAGRVVG